MKRVLILQSFCDYEEGHWIASCLHSVQQWAQTCGYDYQFIGDELFDWVPQWYRRKVGDKLAVATDFARLQWIHNRLDSGAADMVLWVDADVFIFAPGLLQVPTDKKCVFGQEFWLQRSDGKGRGATLQVRQNLHNAYCGFRRDSAVLPFLLETVESLVRRVDERYIAPQFVGPKLLTSLHSLANFALEPRVGACSPMMRQALLDGDEKLLGRVRQKLPVPLAAVNLCHSLVGSQIKATVDEQCARGPSGSNQQMQQLIELFSEFKNGWK